MRTLVAFVAFCGVASVAFGLPTAVGPVTPGVPTGVRQGDIIWDNAPGGVGPEGVSSQQDLVYPFHSQVADDFRLTNPNAPAYVVNGVYWNGVYWNTPTNTNQGFNILFYSDTGGEPTGAGAGDPNVTAILNQFVPLANTNETPDGLGNFNYNTKLAVPFLALTNTTYWLGIQARMVFPPQWGWSSSVNDTGFEGQMGFPLLGANYWQDVGDVIGQTGVPIDMYFRLQGFKVPEPTSLALLGLGGLALIRRRR
jgi:hypothetical protein